MNTMSELVDDLTHGLHTYNLKTRRTYTCYIYE